MWTHQRGVFGDSFGWCIRAFLTVSVFSLRLHGDDQESEMTAELLLAHSYQQASALAWLMC